ncbi:replication-relaxation family protein [Salmonella enterica]
MGHTENITISHQERQRRAQLNQSRILNFLAEEGFSTASLLATLLQFKQTRSVYKIIERLEDKKLIRHKKIEGIERLYTLTPLGHSLVEGDCENYRSISLHNIKPLSLPHKFAIQECKIAMLNNGVEWNDIKGKIKKHKARPDGMIWYQFDDEELRPIAIEVELTVKTKKRYKDILSTYFNPYNHGSKYDAVLYIVPNETMRNRLINLFDDISANGKFFVTTIENFKRKFTKSDLDSRLEAIEKRRTRDKLAEQKRDEERQRQERERQQQAEQDRIDAEKRQQKRAERERQAVIERERLRQEQLSEARWNRAYKWAVRIGIPFIIIGTIFSVWALLFH